MNEKPSPQPIDVLWPFAILCVAFAALLTWNTVGLAQQRAALLRMRDEQQAQLLQSVQANENVRQMMMDLLTLAELDSRAQAIVDKHGIKFTPPAQPAQPPTQVPAPAPALAPVPAPTLAPVAEAAP